MKKHQRIWSRKILRVVQTYNCDSNLLLFGVTGDLDNLGIYVSKYGRPLAENLVDVYNRLIGAFMYGFINKHPNKIRAFCMIPSGEEIFAIGVTDDQFLADQFFSLLKEKVNYFIGQNSEIADKDVSISFGCKAFSNNAIDATISQFIESVSKGRTQEASSLYLELMLAMRRELAYELDRAKFDSLNAFELDLVILFRNVVYAKLRNYKQETKETLVRLVERLKHDPDLLKHLKSISLNLGYGIEDEDVQVINAFLIEE